MLAKVGRFYSLSQRTILEDQRRFSEHVRAREACTWILRNRVGLSYPRIGRFLGQHHTTVMAQNRRAVKRLLAEPGFADEITFIEADLKLSNTAEMESRH